MGDGSAQYIHSSLDKIGTAENQYTEKKRGF